MGAIALVLALLLLGLWGCAREPQRQWYKMDQAYTLAEFRRDTSQCTRDRKLDFACMHARGWVDVTPDRPPPPPASTPGGETQIFPRPGGY